jgi:hypothetical protein
VFSFAEWRQGVATPGKKSGKGKRAVFSRVHQKLGTAGFIISIVALVVALGGGAYAAKSALSGKQKKEVETIARKLAGKDGAVGAQGPKGDLGAAGAAGSNGIDGTQGPKGDKGDKGEAGEIANVVPLAPGNGEGHCEQGGAKIYNETGAAYACNGSGGEGGGGEGGWPEFLPPGKTETGFYEILGENAVGFSTFKITVISFPLRLKEAPIQAVYFNASSHTEEEAEHCPGGTGNPEAAPGYACLYLGLTVPEHVATIIATPIGVEILQSEPAESGFGEWAVTAPTE